MAQLFFIAILIFGFVNTAVEARASKLSLLRQTIFEGYDKLVKPDGIVKVRLGGAIINLETCPHKQVSFHHHLVSSRRDRLK